MRQIDKISLKHTHTKVSKKEIRDGLRIDDNEADECLKTITNYINDAKKNKNLICIDCKIKTITT